MHLDTHSSKADSLPSELPVLTPATHPQTRPMIQRKMSEVSTMAQIDPEEERSELPTPTRNIPSPIPASDPIEGRESFETPRRTSLGQTHGTNEYPSSTIATPGSMDVEQEMNKVDDTWKHET